MQREGRGGISAEMRMGGVESRPKRQDGDESAFSDVDRDGFRTRLPEQRSRPRSELNISLPARDTFRPHTSDGYAERQPTHRKCKRGYDSSPTNRPKLDDPQSPPNMRHSFRRERQDSSPSYCRDHRDDYFDRPVAMSRGYDHYEPRRASSPTRRSSGPGVWQPSPPASPNSPHSVRENQWRAKPLYHNLSWRKPNSPPPPPPPTLAPSKPKIEVNGIKNVPTGPSQSLHPPVDHNTKLLPHIFIPSEYVPALTATRGHIIKILNRFNPTQVLMDDTGYFVTFPVTNQGLMNMTLCEKHHRKSNTMLFGRYPLKMYVFERGQQDKRLSSDEATLESVTIHSPLVEPDEPATASTVEDAEVNVTTETAGTDVEGGLEPASTSETLKRSVSSTHPIASDTLRSIPPKPGEDATAVTPSLMPTYPLPMPSRPGGYDTASSTSGRASSDASGLSGTVRRACHVCKANAGIEPLIKCTTCSRRYHRRCHPSASPLEHGRGWQCQRCIRKEILPKHSEPSYLKTLSDTNRGANESILDKSPDMPLSDTSHDPPAPSQDSGLAQTALMETDLVASEVTTAPDKAGSNYDTNEDNAGMSRSKEASDAIVATTQHQQVDGPLNEAEDLVEKSFTARETMTSSTVAVGRKETGKLNFVRRKLPRNKSETEAAGKDSQNMLSKAETSTAVAPSLQSVRKEGQGELYLPPGVDSDADALHAPSAALTPTITSERASSRSDTHRNSKHNSGTDKTGSYETKGQDDIASASPADSVVQQLLAKPTSTKVVYCEDCNVRRTPHNPMGRTLCSRCRKNAANVLKEPESLVSQLGVTNKERFANTSALSLATKDTAEAFQSEAQLATEGSNDPITGTHTPTHDGNPPVRPGMACDECRRRHKKCDHEIVEETSNDRLISQAPVPAPTTAGKSKTTPNHSVALAPQRTESQSHDSTTSLDDDARQRHSNTATVRKKRVRVQVKSATSSTLPSTPKRLKRQSQRSAPADPNDLGNSWSRPKSTYWRLFAMALCDALNHRIQSVSLPKWVAENIPKYRLGEGSWEGALKATMIMNAKGGSGRILAKRVKWKPGDGGEGEGDWYELLPNLIDELEHWDHDLKRPVVPADSHSQPSSDGEDAAAADDSDVDRQEDLSGLATKTSGGSPGKRKRQRRSLSYDDDDDPDAMEIDQPNFGNILHDDISPDEEPLAPQQISSQSAHTAANFSPAALPTTRTAVDDAADLENGAVSASTNVTALCSFHPAASDLMADALLNEPYLRDLVRQEMESGDTGCRSLLEAWPEHHPSNRLTREDKIKEIRHRKSRKKLFKKGPMQSRLGAREAIDLQPLHFESHIKLQQTPRHLWDQDLPDATKQIPCKTLEEFLGVPTDLVPVIHQGELAFRHNDERKRGVYKTGI